MTEKELLRILFEQVNKSFDIAKKENVEEITLYREFFAKLSVLNGNKKTFEEMRDSGTLFATIGNIRSNKRTNMAINIAKQMLSSKWASSEGRQSIYNKSIKTGTENKGITAQNYDRSVKYMAKIEKQNRKIRKDNALKVIDISVNEVGADLKELWLPPSELLFIINEEIEDRGLSGNLFEDCVEYVQQNAKSLNDMDDMRDAVYHFFDKVLNAEEVEE